MTIQFSPQEIKVIQRYFNKVRSGFLQTQLPQECPEWTTVFLLLRKLLAFGIYAGLQTDSGIPYKELQTKTQKPETMLANVHTYAGTFEQLLAAYTAHH